VIRPAPPITRAYRLAFIATAAALALGSDVSRAAEKPIATARSLGLAEAFRMAVARSEDQAMRGELLEAAAAQLESARGALFPRISLKASELVQQAQPSNADPSLKSFSPSRRADIHFALHQPLFAGFREFAAIQGAGAQGDSLRLQRQRAKELLYLDVARTYVDLLFAQSEIRVRTSLVDLTRKRVDELKSRERIGRSRKSEVLAAKSQLAGLEAAVSEAVGGEKTAQERLRFLTGLTEDVHLDPLPMPMAPATEALLSKASARSDVASKRAELVAAEAAERFAAAGHWPTLSLDANAYPYREGLQKDVHWDALLSADFPLYAGGAVSADVRAARARRRAGEQSLHLTERQAELEIRSAATDVTSSLTTVGALESAAELALQNVEAQNADYRQGLVTNLDVLGALDSYRQARLRLDQAKHGAVLLGVALGVACGSVPE